MRRSADSMAGSLREKSLICRNIKRQIRFYATLPAKVKQTPDTDRESFGDGQKSSTAKSDGPAEMHFYKITSMKDVAPGYYDIPEPVENCQEEVSEGFLVVPGTAFDRQMHRMGYGGELL